MKRTKYFVWCSLWAASALCFGAETGTQRYTTDSKSAQPGQQAQPAQTTVREVIVTETAAGQPSKAKSSEAQAILDALNQERTPMYTEDGQLDPEEVAHVQRMIKLYEMKAGFVDVDAARKQLGLVSKQESAILAQQQESTDEVSDLRSQVSDLQQQVRDLQQQTGQKPSPGRIFNEPAGAQNPNWYGPNHWPGQQQQYYYNNSQSEIKRYP